MIQRALALAVVVLLLGVLGGAAFAQDPETDDLVQLDFNDAPLTEIIDAISKMTNQNFIYDERVRGNVTIKSPTPISMEQAYAVFESVLHVKGFTTVETPGGALKIIPLRDAKETNVETMQSTYLPANRDHFITRLIPLRFVEAESIVNTIKPLVSKDANIAAYAPTNTVILTEAASNIRRILAILEAIDVENDREEIAILMIEHADATTLASQITEIYDVNRSGAAAPAGPGRRARKARRAAKNRAAVTSGKGVVRAQVRIITDTRTNSLIVMTPREQLQDVRRLVARLDVPVSGGGRIHVYYLQHADATDLAATLGSLITGRAAPARGGGAATPAGAQALRAAVTGLAGGIRVNADPATNSLLIQSSKEGFDTISSVIAKLDVERPQVLVEALIIEVDVTDSEELGVNWLIRFINGNTDIGAIIAPAAGGFLLGGPIGAALAAANASGDTPPEPETENALRELSDRAAL
ncbi:MAG: secretin N-terminal domain-containing protein, partial [Myxococcota bacterium]